NIDDSEESESEGETESEFEKEELEDRIFRYSEDEEMKLEQQYENNVCWCSADSDDESIVSQYNEQPKERGSGEAWWELRSDDDYIQESEMFDDSDRDEDETGCEFFFEETEEPPYELD
ncbi:12001_t:CDS:1, partial [Dentiscutata heterogama]